MRGVLCRLPSLKGSGYNLLHGQKRLKNVTCTRERAQTNEPGVGLPEGPGSLENGWRVQTKMYVQKTDL